ncbi:hypothetical protein K435DRAFT_905100 [Dendrothele bispora CBS 962.96]|uniref:Uncharacterized protein n=1 Tax=Dendrothele bispora (strain CBS 962.96) TaxID=1314807 RepID=A0A4S8LUV7_DENBC|nr:hypothetical protein K435DRAFT_905100 [Dendrothele bispora CBS 962.96]
MSSNIHPHLSDLVEIHSHTEALPAFMVGESEGYTLSQFASQVDGYLTSPIEPLHGYPLVQDINLPQGQPELFGMEKLYLQGPTQDMTTSAQNLSIEIPQMSLLNNNININMDSQASANSATLPWGGSPPAQYLLGHPIHPHPFIEGDKIELTNYTNYDDNINEMKWNGYPQDCIFYNRGLDRTVAQESPYEVPCKVEETAHNVSNSIYRGSDSGLSATSLTHFPTNMMNDNIQKAENYMRPDPGIKRRTIATHRVVNHAYSRRKNTPKYFCEVPECWRSFTTPHNYRKGSNPTDVGSVPTDLVHDIHCSGM